MKDDLVEKAMKLVAAAEENDAPLPIIGCLGFRIKTPNCIDLHKKMGREVTDTNFMSYYKHWKKIINLFRDEIGYHWVPPSFARATTLRDFFIDQERQRKIDIFYDHLEFCHKSLRRTAQMSLFWGA